MAHRSHKKKVITEDKKVITEDYLEQFPTYENVKEAMVGRVPTEVEFSHLENNNETILHKNLEIRTMPIVIGVPMDELMFSQFFSNIICLSIMPWDAFITTSDTFVTEARNHIHDGFLERHKAPFLFMVDSDVLPPPDTIERLLAHNLPVVSGVYHKKEKFHVKDEEGNEGIIQRPVVYDYSRFDEDTQTFKFLSRFKDGTGLEKVDGVGAGCLMIRRDVCEKIGKSPYNLKNGGEDLSFCRKITGCGYDIFVDWDLKCGHIGTFFV